MEALTLDNGGVNIMDMVGGIDSLSIGSHSLNLSTSELAPPRPTNEVSTTLPNQSGVPSADRKYSRLDSVLSAISGATLSPLTGGKLTLDEILNMFADGTFKYGKNKITDSFFSSSLEEKIFILKDGFIPFSNDLPILIYSLLGKSSTDIRVVMKVLWSVTKGVVVKVDSRVITVPGMSIAVLRPTTNGDAILRIAHAMTIISTDDGKRWRCMNSCRTRVADITVWVKMYYEQLLLTISFYPSAEYFLYDFRYISVMKPDGDSFSHKEMYIADSRSIQQIKTHIISEFSDVKKVDNVTSDIPPHIRSPNKHPRPTKNGSGTKTNPRPPKRKLSFTEVPSPTNAPLTSDKAEPSPPKKIRKE